MQSQISQKKDNIQEVTSILGGQSRQSHRNWKTSGFSEFGHPLISPKFNTFYIISNNVSLELIQKQKIILRNKTYVSLSAKSYRNFPLQAQLV